MFFYYCGENRRKIMLFVGFFNYEKWRNIDVNNENISYAL